MMLCDSPSSISWVWCSTAHQQTRHRSPRPQRAVSPLFSNERCARVASVAVLDGVTMAALKLGVLNALHVTSSRRELLRRRRSLLSRIKQILHCSLVLACIARATSSSSSQTWSFFVFFASLARALALRPVTLTTTRLQHCRRQSPVAALNDVLRRTPSASSRLLRRSHAPAARRARALATATTSSAKVDRPPRRAPATRRPCGFARTLASIKRRLPPPMSLVWHHAARCCSRWCRCTACTSSPPPRSRRRSKTHDALAAHCAAALGLLRAALTAARSTSAHSVLDATRSTQSINREL